MKSRLHLNCVIRPFNSRSAPPLHLPLLRAPGEAQPPLFLPLWASGEDGPPLHLPLRAPGEDWPPLPQAPLLLHSREPRTGQGQGVKVHFSILNTLEFPLQNTTLLPHSKKNTKHHHSCITAVTVLGGAYEESRPAKKPNRPPRRGAS